MMKKRFNLMAGFLLLSVLSACSGLVPSGDNIDQSLLYGRWQEGSVFERYDETYLGATWDVNDDVSEEEAQLFKWSLEGSTLIHEHIGTFVTVPKVYTITTLTSSSLIYSDDYGKTHSFTKVK